MKMGSSQQYCLRWNNHRSNLLAVFDQLLQNEAFTDVTLACDGGTSVKCHKMVLAACSPYFQCLFTELPCRHPVVVLKDVKYNDMKAILEYMYRGEVNVAHDQLGALLKVAEALKVKGLVEENGREANSSGGFPPSSTKSDQDRNDMSSPPRIGTSSTSISSVPHSSISPPHSTHGNGENCLSNSYGKTPYLYGKSPAVDRSGRINLPVWAVPMPHHPSPVPPPGHAHAAAAAAMLSSCYEPAGSDMSPLKRKKLQSLLMTRDTPILRTVLGQGQVDSSQPVPLVCHPDTQERIHSNGSAQDGDRNLKAEPSEDAPSPFTDISLMDDENSPNDKHNKGVPTSSPQAAFPSDMRGVSSGIATYVPQQKPEWKRYKQYTRNDIQSAIEAVKSGMSALQAARKFGVPSRTLYDKVKKLGITTSRPFKRGSNGGNSNSFPYNMTGALGHVFGGVSENEESVPSHPGGSLLEPMFLQQALERSKGDFGDREALMALASAHAQASAGSGSGSRHSGSNHNSSPENDGRSPSPNMLALKYGRHGSMTPSPNEDDRMEDEDRVEDLSVSRKEIHSAPTGSVIVPPMSLLAKKAEELAELSRERERVRLREREERENEMERERERERERDRERERERERDRDRDRERERIREAEREAERDRHLQDEAENHSSDDSRRE